MEDPRLIIITYNILSLKKNGGFAGISRLRSRFFNFSNSPNIIRFFTMIISLLQINYYIFLNSSDSDYFGSPSKFSLFVFIFLSHGDTSLHFQYQTSIITLFYSKLGIFVLFFGRPHFIELQRDL